MGANSGHFNLRQNAETSERGVRELCHKVGFS